MADKRIDGWPDYKKNILICICLSCLAAFVVLPGIGFIISKNPRLAILEGQVADYATLKADKNLRRLADTLPPSAKQINYRFAPYNDYICVDFTIGKQEFLNWATSRGWKPVEITDTYWLAVWRNAPDPIKVEKGLHHTVKLLKKDDPTVVLSVLEVVFDAEISRCYYRYSHI